MKLPFTFGMNLVFRILLPGFFLALGCLPILQTIVDEMGDIISLGSVFLLATIFGGWLLVVLDMPIYMVFEGRRFWPNSLRKLFIASENRRLRRIESNIHNPRKYLEASVEIRRFPINEEGQFVAKFPTRVGNLIAAYEDYPNRIYGMDAPFYWPRIWLKISNDLRIEIDNQLSIVDSALYTSFVFFVNGILFIIYIILEAFNFRYIKPIANIDSLYIFPVFLLLGYILYRGTLHIHAQFGELFKSVFDLYGNEAIFPCIVEEVSNKLNNSQSEKSGSKEQNQIAWRYLHNYRIKCPVCGKVVVAPKANQHKCGD